MSYQGSLFLQDDYEFEDDRYDEDDRENDDPQEESDEGNNNVQTRLMRSTRLLFDYVVQHSF